MKRMLNIAAGCLALTVLAAPTPADELNRRWVAPDAEWIIHIDVERLRESALGKILLSEGDLADAREQIQAELGVDITKDLHGLTAYGRGDWGDSGVLIATSTAAADDVLAAIQEQGDGYASRTVGDRVLHSFDAEDGRVYAYLGERRNDGRVIVLSDEAEIVMEALRVMSDRDVANTKIEVPSGLMIFAAASDLDRLPEFDATSQVLEGAHDVSLAVREDDDATTAQLGVATESGQQAKDISAVIQGLFAAGRLMAGHDEELAFLTELINGISVKARGASLHLSITLSNEMLEEIMEEAGAHAGDLEWN